MRDPAPHPLRSGRAATLRIGRLVLVLVVAVLVGAACQVTTTVDVAVQPDGSGKVTVTAVLDAAAAARMPDLDQSLLVADLRTAGWTVTPPRRVPGGGWQVVAAKPFATTAQLGAVMSELGGKDGPFRRFALTRTHHFAKTQYQLTGTVDLSGGIDSFGDPALRQALGGKMFGRTDAQLEQELGQPVSEAVHLRLVTHVPGGGTKEWTPKLGDDASTISASGADRSPVAWLFAFAALLAAAGFVATVLLIARYNRIKAPPSYVHRPGAPRRPWDDDL